MITPAYSPTATERVLPRLALDFTTGTLDSRVTVARALNTATRVNSSGNIEVVNANLPRFDYDPSTLACKGLLIEETRTNGITNNTATGAVAGSPGTAPTSWFPTSTTGVFTRTIVGTGTENGIAYVDIRYQTSGSGNASVQFEGSNAIAATNGQTWTHSGYVKLVGGTLTNVSFADSIIENDAAGNFLAGATGSNYIPTSAALVTQRRSYTRTNTNALTAFVYSRTRIAFSGAGDVTLRFGLPQLELGAFATSVVQTSSGAVTRNADAVSMTGANFSSWYAASANSIAVSVTPITVSGVRPACQADDGTANEVIALRGNAADPELYIVDGGVAQAQIDAGAISANTTYTLCGAWALNNCAASKSGGTPGTDVSATIPTPTQLRIGSDGANYLCGWVRTLRSWPQRITNAETQAFSS